MDLLLILVYIMSLIVLPDLAYDIRSTQWTRSASLDDFVFQDHLLWIYDSSSRLSCAKLCAEDASCKTFTFTKVTSERMTCRGHSQPMTSGGTFAAGTVYYVSTDTEVSTTAPQSSLVSSWLQKPCSSNAECSVSDSECFMDRCLCTPGYYFYTSTDSCKIGCSDIQDDFVKYPTWYMSFNNLDDKYISFDECRAWCLTLSNCVSIEYSPEQSKCYVAAVTVLDAPSAWRQANSNLSYWQRTCL